MSEAPFAGVDARLSRYSYLVSLLPRQIVDELGLRFETRRRRISSYTPVPGTDAGGAGRQRRRRPHAGLARGATARSTPGSASTTARGAWRARVFPTLLEPLPTRDELRERIGDDEAWEALFERPIGEAVEAAFADDVLRGIVADRRADRHLRGRARRRACARTAASSTT